MPQPPILAVDFGTSNSAAAILDGGKVRPLAIEGAEATLPTAIFLHDEGGMEIGRAAAEALVAGDEGRYLRALKSVLGTPLLHEMRPIAGRRRSLAQLVTAYLSTLKAGAEAQAGMRFDRVLSGRPVRFHSPRAGEAPEAAAARDAQAEADLRACYQAAGFARVDFLPEPEAAARAWRAADPDAGANTLALIVDIGGGTSDFTVLAGGRVLASHGIRLGGTDFDTALSMAHVMPHLGFGGQLRRTLGEGLLPMPRAIFADLASWPMIPFLYTPETARKIEDLLRHAVAPGPIRLLQRVVGQRLGHGLAFAVEAGKIAANQGVAGQVGGGAAIDLGMVAPGLRLPISRASIAPALEPAAAALRLAMLEVLHRAGIAPTSIEAVVLVGGSSLMARVADEARATCPSARLIVSQVFTAVVDGLALASADLAG